MVAKNTSDGICDAADRKKAPVEIHQGRQHALQIDTSTQ